MRSDWRNPEVRRRLIFSALVVVADIAGLVVLAVSGLLTAPLVLMLMVAAVLLVRLIWRR